MTQLEPWQRDLLGRSSETSLVSQRVCPKCGSRDTVFHKFRGARENDESGRMCIRIVAEEHVCRSCWHEFTIEETPWKGLELAAWAEAMRQGLTYDRVGHFTDWIRKRLGGRA